MPSENEKKRHERFYFDDGNVTFLVENTLLKIHRFFFNRDSEVFREMFSFKPAEGEEKEGTSDENPIRLEGQDLGQMECFLSVLYPVTFLEVYDCSFWFSYLHFAVKWGFKPQEELAMDRLKKLDKPAFVIAAGRLHGLGAESLAPYFVKMFDQAPTLEDGQALGLNDLVLLCQMQNYRRARCGDSQMLRVDYAQAVLEGVKAGDAEEFAIWRNNRNARYILALRAGINSPAIGTRS